MAGMRIVRIIILLSLLCLGTVSCTHSSGGLLDENRRVAEKFIKSEATYQFDGLSDTLKMINATSIADGWLITYQFDSRHAGYGNRTGQELAQVIIRHVAEVTVQDGVVTHAILDGQWDMINQCIDVEIKLAPIDKVRVYTMKSNPAQIGVYIKGGLVDGCTTFHDIEISRDGNIVDIKVTVQRPRGIDCPAVYTWFEKDVNLGTDFVFGTTYTLNVNNYSTTFNGTLMNYEGFAIYLTRDDVPPDKMEMLSHVDITDKPVISIQDIISYDAQTHEIKLTDQAFERITEMEVPISGKSFLVCVNRAPVYWGAFWTPISSMSFAGVTISQPLGTMESKIITLDLGYPSTPFYSGEDPRDNTLVFNSLREHNRLINEPPVKSVAALPHSFKGYELYSWLEDGQWHFTLITGTNRTKTIQEITSSGDIASEAGWVKIHATGVDVIKETLGRLPQQELAVWCGDLHIGPAAQTELMLPPGQIVDEIRDYAIQCGLDFTVAWQR